MAQMCPKEVALLWTALGAGAGGWRLEGRVCRAPERL
jgi:hypothetical protein